MKRQFVGVAAAVLVGTLAGGAMSSALAGDIVMRPDEARRFVANKLFSYTCFDGTNGAGRIHADGSVVGTMQAAPGGPVRFVSLPSGTIRLTTDSICAALPNSLIQPCFNLVQTSPHSFRGSVQGFGFAYCDFVRRSSRADLVRSEEKPRPVRSAAQAIDAAITLRPSRY